MFINFFSFENVRLFVPLEYANSERADHVLEVNFNQNLKDVLSHENIKIKNFLPVLQVFLKFII